MNQESLWPSGLGYSPCLELHRIRYSLQRWRRRVGAKGCHVYREGQECRATTLKSLSLAQSLFTQHNNCFSLSCIAMNFIRQSPSLGYKFLRSLLICFYFLLPKHLEHSLKTYNQEDSVWVYHFSLLFSCSWTPHISGGFNICDEASCFSHVHL